MQQKNAKKGSNNTAAAAASFSLYLSLSLLPCRRPTLKPLANKQKNQNQNETQKMPKPTKIRICRLRCFGCDDADADADFDLDFVVCKRISHSHFRNLAAITGI